MYRKEGSLTSQWVGTGWVGFSGEGMVKRVGGSSVLSCCYSPPHFNPIAYFLLTSAEMKKGLHRCKPYCQWLLDQGSNLGPAD